MDKVGALDCFYCPFDSLDDQHPADDSFELAHLTWSEEKKEAILARLKRKAVCAGLAVDPMRVAPRPVSRTVSGNPPG